MALIKCPECRNKIPEWAEKCNNCGASLKPTKKVNYRKYGEAIECPNCSMKIIFTDLKCPLCDHELVKVHDWCEECHENYCEHTIEYWEIIDNEPLTFDIKVVGAMLKCKACKHEFSLSWFSNDKPVFNCPECGRHKIEVLEYL